MPEPAIDTALLARIDDLARGAADWGDVLESILRHFDADSGTIHLMEDDGHLHLRAASRGIPQVVLETVRTVPVGKGMAGLAVERRQPVGACNLQSDSTGDVRPGARATGLQGSIVVPILRGDRAVGALGIGNFRERVFTDEETALLLAIGAELGRNTPAERR